MWILQSKMNIWGGGMSLWPRKQICDVHKINIEWEIKLQTLEEIDIQVNTQQSR